MSHQQFLLQRERRSYLNYSSLPLVNSFLTILTCTHLVLPAVLASMSLLSGLYWFESVFWRIDFGGIEQTSKRFTLHHKDVSLEYWPTFLEKCSGLYLYTPHIYKILASFIPGQMGVPRKSIFKECPYDILVNYNGRSHSPSSKVCSH